MVEVLNRMDYRIDHIGVIGTYHANKLKQYVECQSMTSHSFDEANEMDKYSLDDCTFLSTQCMELYKDISISNELPSEQICEADSIIE